MVRIGAATPGGSKYMISERRVSRGRGREVKEEEGD
jgi:hypothetical protein